MELLGLRTVNGCPDCVLALGGGRWIGCSYNLDPATGLKTGSFFTFEDLTEQLTLSMKEGLLDMKLHKERVLSVSSQGNIHYVDPESLKIEQVKNLSSASGTYIHTTESSAFISFIDGSVCSLDIPTARLLHTKKYNSYEIWCVLATESLLFVPGSEGQLTVYDRSTDNCILSLHTHQSDITSMTLNGHSLTTGSYDGTLRTYDTRTHRELRSFQFPGGVWRHLASGPGWLAGCMEEGFHYKSPTGSFVLPTASLAYSLAEISPNSYMGSSFYSQEVLKFSITHHYP